MTLHGLAGYAATPWPAEDGGPARTQRPHGIAGPNAGGGRCVAVRQAPLSVMVVHGPGNRLYLLRREMGADGPTWVEEIDPITLDAIRRSPDLPTGPFWPGGLGVLADGSVLVVQGRWAHRLDPDLGVLAARALPVDAPHNSFVLLDDATVATKDLQRPGGPPSTLSLLDPETLADRAAPVTLHEPSVARLSAAGGDLAVVGVTTFARYAWDPATASLTHRADLDARYLVHPDQSFGWDPVCAAGAWWWLDMGDHTFERSLTMLGNGVAAGPVRLWRADLADGTLTSVEVTGARHGAVTNPPLVDEDRGLVLAYDSANGAVAAFDTATLARRWTRDLASAQHLILFPDTGEVVADDHRPDGPGDAVVVLDVATGDTRARIDVPSPAQSVVFGAPGTDRDVLYVSLTTIARTQFHDAPAP